MENVLEIRNLSKSFKQYNVLNDINLTIKRGDIYGLIGKNGAGKTTLLKIITSLSKENKGTIQLFGSSNHSDFIHALQRTGSVIETPVAYDNLSAKQNLSYYAKLRGVIDEKDIDDTLELVDLADVGKKKFKHFSLGMKQKLGIAIALLSKPDFLILDEPINGLDPIAIVEFRELLKKLNTELNITILISSHILTELYHVANRFGILNNGTLVEEITKDEFEKMSQTMINIQVNNTDKLIPILHNQLIHDFKVVSASEINIYEPNIEISELLPILVNEGIIINGIYKTGMDLENHFKELVDGTTSHTKEGK